MRPGKKINWLAGGIVMGAFLLSGGLLSEAGEITFLKVKFMRVQEELGRQIKESGQLQQREGEIQERLGTLIRDAGLHGEIDQESIGKGVAEAAHLKWQEGAIQERLGLAIQKSAGVVLKEAEITGKGRIQERIGAMILAKAQLERVGAEKAKIAALIEAREAQEALGRQIQKTAQLKWAEEVMVKAVQTNFHAPSSLETTPARIPDEAFPIIRSTFGFGHEQDLRLGLALLEKETGRPLKEIVPAPEEIVSSGAVRYSEAGWGGFWEFGLFAIASFMFAIWMFTWVWADLEGPKEEAEEKPWEFRKAA